MTGLFADQIDNGPPGVEDSQGLAVANQGSFPRMTRWGDHHGQNPEPRVLAPSLGRRTIMALRDPFAAYNAANNLEAHLVCNLLNDAGIEAYVIEDLSQVGVWLGGLIPEIHKPQVWIERADVERAKPFLEDYERRAEERRRELANAPPVEVVCEECGKTSPVPGQSKGVHPGLPPLQRLGGCRGRGAL